MLVLVQIVSAADDAPVRIKSIPYYLDAIKKEAKVAYDRERRIDLDIVVIPETVSYDGETYKVTSIGEEAFVNCPFSNITLPNSILSIEKDAFGGCKNLKSITIPKSVKYIANGFLNFSDGVTSIVVDKDNEVYDSRNDCNAIIETETNELIQGCQNTIIPNTVKRIGDQAFAGIRTLTSLDIPNSVKSIGSRAFDNTGLKTFTMPNSVLHIGTGVFDRCAELTSLTLSESLDVLPDATISGCEKLKSVVIPSSIKNIEESAFFDSGLESITFMSPTIPKGLLDGGEIMKGLNLSVYVMEKLTIHVPVGCKDEYKGCEEYVYRVVDDVILPEQATGVSKIQAINNKSSVYNLSGTRISAPRKGINIKNGKKYILK